MKLIHKLKSKLSETYRIKHGWGLSPIRNERELKALIEFCENELQHDYIQLNPERKKIYQATIFLYRYYDHDKHGVMRFQLSDGDDVYPVVSVHEFIRTYFRWYWS